MQKEYPVFTRQSDEHFLVYIPDFDIYTEEFSFEKAIKMAKDAIELSIDVCRDDGEPVPEPSTKEEALSKAKTKADGNSDFSNSQLVFVTIDTDS